MTIKDTLKKIILENMNIKREIITRDISIPTNLNKVISLIGSRRSGKTYLLFQKINQLIQKGISKEEILYFNFEDERISDFTTSNFEDLLDAFYELFPNNINKKIYLFLDEIQEIEKWEKFIRRLSETKKYYIFITGSSSKLLSKEINTSLRGRTIPYYIFPFSFKEYLNYNNIKIEENIFYTDKRHKIKNLFQKYIEEGGFPETFGLDKNFQLEILQNYSEMIFYKDIVERYQIRNFKLMRNLMKFLITNSGKLFSITSYYNLLKSQGIKLGKETLFEYISYLEDANFTFLIPIYSTSLKVQQVNPPKNYTIDTGFSNAISFKFSEDTGRLLENVVFIELKRRGKEIYYHRIKAECDFVISDRNQIIEAIQVTKSLDDIETKKREIKGLLEACKTHNLKTGLILTQDEQGEEVIDNIKIKIMPIWKWLLEK